MPLSRKSQMVFVSIFKGEPNARRKFDWAAFNKVRTGAAYAHSPVVTPNEQAMVELGFDDIERDGVVFRYRVPARWGGGTLVLHMDAGHKVEKSGQNGLKAHMLRAFGWDQQTFLDGQTVSEHLYAPAMLDRACGVAVLWLDRPRRFFITGTEESSYGCCMQSRSGPLHVAGPRSPSRRRNPLSCRLQELLEPLALLSVALRSLPTRHNPHPNPSCYCALPIPRVYALLELARHDWPRVSQYTYSIPGGLSVHEIEAQGHGRGDIPGAIRAPRSSSY
ncbi:hypothetical protein C8Q79DRAFT_924233 [Trametes meyenii]|nr:hypothetical protein C8Q79DRAFT_924233 [Trametes meyenii]